MPAIIHAAGRRCRPVWDNGPVTIPSGCYLGLTGRGHGPLLRVEWRHSQGADERPNKRGDNDD
jgi:hypothetical protein